jgi:hypothetical protein
MNLITVDPKVIGGVPCLRGLRIPVATVVNMVASGISVQEIVGELPPLEAGRPDSESPGRPHARSVGRWRCRGERRPGPDSPPPVPLRSSPTSDRAFLSTFTD